jgi:ERCC4-type nuclease
MARNKKRLSSSDRVPVYAKTDIKGGDGKVVMEAGTRQIVFQVDAREMCQRGQFTLRRPDKVVIPQGEKDRGDHDTKMKLTDITGVNAHVAQLLIEGGYGTVDDLRRASVDDLLAIPGIGERYAESIKIFLSENPGDSLEDDDQDDEGEE